MKIKELIIFVLSLALVLFVSTQYISIKQQQLKSEAVNGCMQVAGLTETATNTANSSTKYSYPNRDIYLICIADKGYSTTWKK